MGIFSSIGKFLFGGNKKTTSNTQNSTTRSDVDPWDPSQRYLTDQLAELAKLYGPDGAPQVSPVEDQGYQRLLGTVNSGQGDVTSAINENNKTLSGAYLTPDTNPYLADIAKRISGIAGSTNNATFGGRGRSTGGLAGYYAGKGVGDSLTDFFGKTYENERSRMGAAAGMAPELARGAFTAPQALISAGQNITARPFDLASQYTDLITKIGSMGQQGLTNSTGTVQNQQYQPGLISKVANSLTNKLFGT